LKQALRIDFAAGYLRPLAPADVHPDYVAGLNDPEVNRFLVHVRRVRQTADIVTQYVEQNLRAPDAVLFGIWMKGEGRHCGTVRLHDLDREHGPAHIGICIFERRKWRAGVGATAIRAVSDWACGFLGLTAIEAGVYADNLGSQRAFLSAGYAWRKDVADPFEAGDSAATVRVYEFSGPADVPPESS
jgi:RimJ/RimL family protein N-acetyltransferase